MPIQRISIIYLQEVVESRQHRLISFTRGRVDPDTVPQASYITVECTLCNHKWSPTLQSYLKRSSRNRGCRQCFNNNIQNRELYPNSPFSRRPDVVNRPARRAGVSVLRTAHLAGPYGSIGNRQQLINFLRRNPDAHNDYVLPLVIRDTQFPKTRDELPSNQYSFHHVIPLHTQGSPDAWNIIYVTKEEHHRAHELRYQVYQDISDLRATYATAADLERFLNQTSSTENSIENETQEDSNQGVARRNALLARRTPETLKAIKEGMVWTHQTTGIQVIIQPNSVQTIQDIKQLLINSLPINNSERKRMLSNEPSSNNYIRQYINTVFRLNDSVVRTSRSSAYGFIVQSLQNSPRF